MKRTAFIRFQNKTVASINSGNKIETDINVDVSDYILLQNDMYIRISEKN